MACSSVCSLSGASRYMTCSTGASKPVSSMSQTTRMESGSPRSLKRSITRSCSSLRRCQRTSRSSSLCPADMISADSGAFSPSRVSLNVTAVCRLAATTWALNRFGLMNCVRCSIRSRQIASIRRGAPATACSVANRCLIACAFQASPMVGLLHSMTASGRPLTNATTSGRVRTCFFDPSTLNCRVTIHSFRSGLSKSRNRTAWLLRPPPRSCSRAMP